MPLIPQGMPISVSPSVLRILDHAADNLPLSKEECRLLLSFSEQSLESGVLTVAADHISRRRFHNRSMLLGQIGIEATPCSGGCKFCAFGEGGHSSLEFGQLSGEQIVDRARAFCKGNDLYALFLMTMHSFDFSRLLEIISQVRRSIPLETRIVINAGDLTGSQGDELRSAGVDGAYHICRLREGKDTELQPSQRLRTLEIIKKAGLDLYYCCEPIGPEHSPEELVEQIFIGINFGCLQHGAMRRIPVPGTPMASSGRISERRLSQIVAVASLATVGHEETGIIIVHEPSLLGLCAGANAIYAETGANPRDTAADTKGHRGLDMRACREILCDAGFTELRYGDSVLPLRL